MFLELCGSPDVPYDDDEWREEPGDEALPRSAMAELGIKARLNRRLRTCGGSKEAATLSLSPSEVHVLTRLTEKSHESVTEMTRKATATATTKSSEDFFDRLRNQVSNDVDLSTAESIMSAFGATPKSRRQSVLSASGSWAEGGGRSPGRRASFRKAIKKVIHTNRLKQKMSALDRLPGRLSGDQKAIVRQAFDRVSAWDFDIWAVYDSCGGDERLAAQLVAEEIVLERRKVVESREGKEGFCGLLRTFFREVLAKYEKNPYHGALHGADVLQGVHALLASNARFEGALGEDTLLIVLVAALAHDVGHPGLTNAFLVESSHELAVRYNDHSPLENMHARVALDLAKPWLSTMDRDVQKRARFTWIELVLATDMKEHAAAIFGLEHELSKNPDYDAAEPGNHTTCLKIFIHAADLSNPTKAWPTYERWTKCIMEEFYAQADKEKADGHKLTVPLRGECKMDKFQLGFLGFIRPLFVTATKITNVDMQDQIDGLDAIAKKWQDKAAAEAAGDAAEDADNVRR